MSAPIIKYLGEAGTRELVTLIKADLAKKEELSKFTTMPPAADHIGRIVQFIGATVPLYTKGYFYYSDGAVWTQINVQPATQGSGGFEVVDILPAWSTADPEKVYYVKNGTVLSGYIKEPATANVWYSLAGGASTYKFEIVTALPSWVLADANTVYFIPDGDNLAGYIKNVSQSGKFYALNKEVHDVLFVTALPSWATADATKLYMVLDSATSKMTAYKKGNVANQWYELDGGTGSMQFVTELPDWSAAVANTAYILNENGKLSVYTKGATANQWNELAGHEALPIATIDEVFEEVFD